MDIKLIQQLKSAGVGDDVIVNLILQQNEEAPQPVTVQQEAKEPEPERPAEPEKKVSAPDPIMEKIDKLIGVIQASNLIRSGRESAPEDSVDDILAAMVQPRKKED